MITSASSEQPQQAQSQHEYIIWPRKNMEPEGVRKTEDAIRSIIDSKEPIENYTSQLNGLRSWFVLLTVAQAEEVEKLDGVNGIQKDGPDPDQTDDGNARPPGSLTEILVHKT